MKDEASVFEYRIGSLERADGTHFVIIDLQYSGGHIVLQLPDSEALEFGRWLVVAGTPRLLELRKAMIPEGGF